MIEHLPPSVITRRSLLESVRCALPDVWPVAAFLLGLGVSIGLLVYWLDRHARPW